MSRTERHLAASADAVFDVLADGFSYADWVVGARDIRAVDPGWPEAGSRIHHSIGIPPFVVQDVTTSTGTLGRRRLDLDAHVRPLGKAHITFELSEEGGGTRVTMLEEPTERVSRLAGNFVVEGVLHLRNMETLRRLGRIVRTRAHRS